jgi:GNAT superfamily N-acetyltransferase
VHLRALMLSSMGTDVGGADAPWRGAAGQWFADQLARPQGFAGFVVEHPRDGVVSVALGSCDARAPGPIDASGVHGHVFNVSTEPAHRRNGYARDCLDALLDWFRAETPVRMLDLNASAVGAGMYESAGFVAAAYPEMRMLLERPADG